MTSGRSRDEGTVSVIIVLLTGALLALAALVWDGGRAITARQQAADLAEQAARAGADDLDLNAVRSTGADQLDVNAATTDACHYVEVAAPAATCDATVHDGEVTVHVTTRSPTAVLGLIGFHQFAAHGWASAHAQRGVVTGETP